MMVGLIKVYQIDKYECPFVRWEETDYDVVSGHSCYEPVCTKVGSIKERCYRYFLKYCKLRQGDTESATE